MMKVRASQLGKIMTNDRSGKNMGASALTALRESFIEYHYGRRKEVYSKYLKKGTEVEEVSIEILSEHDGVMYIKNDERKENDFIQGECDIAEPDEIIDVKSSWDLYTFWNAEGPISPTGKLSDYGWQLTAYGWLWGVKNLRLAYVMSDTPEDVVEGIIYKNALQMEGGDSNPKYESMARRIRKQHTFDDLPVQERVRCFSFTLDPNDIDKIKARVEMCQAIIRYWEANTLHAPVPKEMLKAV